VKQRKKPRAHDPRILEGKSRRGESESCKRRSALCRWMKQRKKRGRAACGGRAEEPAAGWTMEGPRRKIPAPAAGDSTSRCQITGPAAALLSSPLSSLPSFLDFPPAQGRAACPRGVYARDFPPRAAPCPLPARVHGRMAFPQRAQGGCACFSPVCIAFPLLWRPSDTLATPNCAKRRHRPEGHGGPDAQV